MGFHLPELFIMLLTVFWLTAFIHCIVNKWLKGGEKVAWVLFFLFANWIGALSYFIYWYGFAKQKRSRVVTPVRLSDISSRDLTYHQRRAIHLTSKATSLSGRRTHQQRNRSLLRAGNTKRCCPLSMSSHRSCILKTQDK